MPKAKSSATSGTRKKHARKAAGPEGDPLPKDKKVKGKDRGKKSKEPRQKMYIAPVKPMPIQPDPLDTMGLAHRLPPDLLVVLRSLTKKATVTKTRALEELQSNWVDKCLKQGEESDLVYPLIDMLPVWLHHVSALFIHPSRRVRLITAAIHATFLRIPTLRDEIFNFIRDSTSSQQVESILGTWVMAAHDVDRQVAIYALKSWVAAMSLHAADVHSHLIIDQEILLPRLVSFTQRVLLDPIAVYNSLNPVAPSVENKTSAKGGRPSAASVATRELAEQNMSRTKADDLEESEIDRKARIRVGAFGATRWMIDNRSATTPIQESFFANPALWSSIHHAETCTFTDASKECFGFGQTVVRKAAWGLIQSLLKTDLIVAEGLLLPILSTAILRSAWVEPDTTVLAILWEPLLTFLKKFPSAWELEASYSLNSSVSDSENESEDEEVPVASSSILPQKSSSTEAYTNFLQFLELGCSGAPLQGYSAVVIILSTMSSSIIASSTPNGSLPLSVLFTSFWAAIDGRALSSLQRNSASAAFLSSLLECVVFLVRRVRTGGPNQLVLLKSSADIVHASEEFVREQIARVWTELAQGTLRLDERIAARLIGRTLSALESIDSGLFNAAWETLVRSVESTKSTSPTLIPVLLTVLDEHFSSDSELRGNLATKALISTVLEKSIGLSEASLSSSVIDDAATGNTGIEPLAGLLDAFKHKLFADPILSQQIDDLMTRNASRLLSVSSSLLILYLSCREDQQSGLKLWHILLADLAGSEKSLFSLLGATKKSQLPDYLKPADTELDERCFALMINTLDGLESTDAVYQVLKTPEHFLSPNGLDTFIQFATSAFQSRLDKAFVYDENKSYDVHAALDVVRVIFDTRPELLKTTVAATELVSRIYLAGHFLPECDSQSGALDGEIALRLWALWNEQATPETHRQAILSVKSRLRELICDIHTSISSSTILRLASTDSLGGVDLMTDILPSRKEIDSMLDTISPDPIDQSIGVSNALIPPISFFQGKHLNEPQVFDSLGYSAYARIVTAVIYIFSEDRQLGKDNLWALRHVLALSIYASDFIEVPWAKSPVFGIDALKHNLPEIVHKAQQISTYLIISPQDDTWGHEAISSLTVGKPSPLSLEGPARFLWELIEDVKSRDTIRDSRILYNVLHHILDKADILDADNWVVFARKIEKAAPQTSITIIAAVTAFAPDPPRLDRYRNEIAADLLGVKAHEADTKGLRLLQKLGLSAPSLDSDVVFLPQLRAINVVKALQSWVASDDGVEEEVEREMTLVFLYLAPILQNAPGSHWDLVFDILESNLETCSFDDDSTLVTLSRTLKLIISIQDLAVTNKVLREDWRARELAILTLVRDLATVPLHNLAVSAPRSVCRELVLEIVQTLPPSLIDQDTLPKMCHLLADPATDVQKLAYHLLKGAAHKRTEHLVMEAGVDVESIVKSELPTELIHLLQRTIGSLDGSELSEQLVFGYLLGWMVAFDSFQDASLKVRSGYIDQLRGLSLFSTHFIPTIIRILGLDNGLSKAFKLDIWAIDEYYVQLYELGKSFSVSVLAAHLYYRALLTVPSLIHTWVLDCKDRQLSTSIVTYTAQHFSPVLIQAELAHVKSPEATAELVDDQMSVKVSFATNEVSASYLVDEHQLEIRLKIPVDYPLHKIEIKEVKPVGVDENRWRAWILAIQQTIWAHNSRIADGLILFKKNVTLHFKGQVDCAICYSIISVSDGDLPRKPCKTCKNRFHSSCLYKWFNSSHSSSCPLCRSDIF